MKKITDLIFVFISFAYFSLFFLPEAYCVPAKRTWKNLTLADGSVVFARLVGDELVHYYKTSDGRTFTENFSDGIFRPMNESAFLVQWQMRRERRNAVHVGRAKKTKSIPSVPSCIVSREKRGLVILVEFPDRKLEYGTADYQPFFNSLGYSDHGMSGSVRDYFLDQSYGALDVQFDVVGPVAVSLPLTHYGQNDTYGMDKYPAQMVIEACKLVDENIDFSRYDWNGDGEVEQVFLIYAGYGEAQNAPANTIWPHEYTLTEAEYFGDGTGAMFLDEVLIDTYACSCELSGYSGNAIDPIGTACHEFSHCLDLPDTYDPNYRAFGMDHWDIMDAGAYNNDGRTPAAFTAWERMHCGWLQPTELQNSCIVTDMQPLTVAPEAYIIYNQQNRNEYYLLENRQNEGWDVALLGHGLLVLHVDYDATAWSRNEVNAVYSHQRMTLIPANNNFRGINHIYSPVEYAAVMAGNPYPGTSGNTELTDRSIPASTLYTPNVDGRLFMNAPVSDIEENDGCVSFCFGGVYVHIPRPQALPAADVTVDGFTACWSSVPEATAYEVVIMARDTAEIDSTDIEESDAPFCRVSSQILHRTTGTLFVFSGLESQKFYSYKVRALIDEVVSEWSNTVQVMLPGQSSSLQASTAPNCMLGVLYDMMGRKVMQDNRLPAGIYIRSGKKVLLR